MSIPDCTLVTACFCMQKYHKDTFNMDKILIAIKAIVEVPCYIVFFGDDITISIIKNKRQEFKLDHLSKFIILQPEDMWSFTLLDKVKKNREIYFPSRDHRTSAETHLITVNKFDFVLQIIESDPFNTSKFGWIDCFLSTSEKKCRISEDYSIEKFINILNDITDKFHIQILNVCDKKYKLDENKREYYSRYQHVV